MAFFHTDCGGYINGDGIFSTPNYLTNTDISDCYWFIEARNNGDTILLINFEFLSSSQGLDDVTRREVFNDNDYENNYDQQTIPPASTTMLPSKDDPPPIIIASVFSRSVPL